MVTMATPWRHPQTGVFYLRRQIPKPLREEFGGKTLVKRSLDTKDASDARRIFADANAELERRFAGARAAIAVRSAASQISDGVADRAVARISSIYRGTRFARFPVLAGLYWSEEAASAALGDRQAAIIFDPISRRNSEFGRA